MTASTQSAQKSHLEQIIDGLAEKKVRPHYLTNGGFNLKLAHTFSMRGRTLYYIRGFTRYGAEFEAYIPRIQDGQVIAHLAGFGILPSMVETEKTAEDLLGGEGNKKESSVILTRINEAGYYGNTLLKTALEGRASVVVYAKGFNSEVKGFWSKYKHRLVTDKTAKQQLQDAIALGEIFSTRSGSPAVALASHSLTTQEAVRFLADPHSYTIDDYCNATSVKSIIFQSLYTTPDNAVRNAEPFFEKIKAKLKTEKSLFWKPLFEAAAYLYKKLGAQLPGVQPFFGSFKKYQLSEWYINKNVSPAWQQAKIVNAASAAYFLASPYATLHEKIKDPALVSKIKLLAFIPEKDAICSPESQQTLYTKIKQWISTVRLRQDQGITLPFYSHNIFVDYPEKGSDLLTGTLAQVHKQCDDYIHCLTIFTA